MCDHQEYLAIHVLNESQTISYRQLARALKLHSSIAKQCLYDFHSRQTCRKPSSVHATYLLTGLRHPPSSQPQHDGDDDVPMSSPYQSSQPGLSQDHQLQSSAPPPPPTRVVLIAAEAELEKAKATLDKLTSIHIYSLSPSPVTDLQTLTDCNRRVAAEYYSEDPLEQWGKYGVIQNERVWRRTRKGAAMPPPPEPVVAVPQPAAKSRAPQDEPEKTQHSAPSSQRSTDSKKDRTAAAKEEKKPPALKKESSSLFKSFAKAKPPRPKEKEEDDSAPALSDEEADEADMMDLDLDRGSLDHKDSQTSAVDPGKSKKERQEELMRMMEEEEEEEEEEEDDEMAVDDAAPAPVEEEKAQAEALAEQPAEDEAKGETVQVEGGRRRGRRRVMKKRTVKDEEGYLVTKEEAAWESFSEDEAPATKKARPSIMAQAAAKSAADRGAKKGGKPGQNSIMSFFAKK